MDMFLELYFYTPDIRPSSSMTAIWISSFLPPNADTNDEVPGGAVEVTFVCPSIECFAVLRRHELSTDHRNFE